MQGEWVFQEPKTQSGWRTHSLIYLKVGWHRAGTLISSLDFWLHSSWRSHRYFICFSPFSIPLSSSSSVLFVAQTPPTLRTLLSSIFISPPPLNPLLSFQLLTRTLQVSPVYPTFSTSLTLLIHCPLPFSSPHPQVSALQIPSTSGITSSPSHLSHISWYLFAFNSHSLVFWVPKSLTDDSTPTLLLPFRHTFLQVVFKPL